MTSLHALLSQYRSLSQSEREKGTYFERLIQCYLTHEASYKDLYEHVWMYADWAREQGVNAQDAGIDLVARTTTGELHAVQCKLYAEDYRLQKSDIDSFFTASGKKTFSHRLIVSTTNLWSAHAEQALENQQPPVTRITLADLEQSQIDWSHYQPSKAVLKPRKELRPHQRHAVGSVREGLQNADRGKLIMACGSGKTFTALKIAEEVAGKNGRVLFLVPSLSLLSQTLTEWTQESATPLHCFAVCSDSDVGKKATSEDDAVPVLLHELRYPATTDAKSLAREMEKRHDAEHMSVVFSTYHSIEVLSQAQKKHGLAEFDLFASDAPKTRTRRDAITKEGLAHFQAAYPGEKIVREDIFYYVYGLLHSPDYRERYADNLSKELPRIPCVKQASDFWAFSKAGRALANLHLNYETVEPYPCEVARTEVLAGGQRAQGARSDVNPSEAERCSEVGERGLQSERFGIDEEHLYRVEKMRYGKTRRDGKSVDDKTILVYNDFVTLRGIPLEAYDYVVNGKSALDWVVERQCVKVDKDSGIVNDANLWALETMENPKYPLELFQRVVTVSLETMKIVNGLPGLEIAG